MINIDIFQTLLICDKIFCNKITLPTSFISIVKFYSLYLAIRDPYSLTLQYDSFSVANFYRYFFDYCAYCYNLKITKFYDSFDAWRDLYYANMEVLQLHNKKNGKRVKAKIALARGKGYFSIEDDIIVSNTCKIFKKIKYDEDIY